MAVRERNPAAGGGIMGGVEHRHEARPMSGRVVSKTYDWMRPMRIPGEAPTNAGDMILHYE
jgi:hypothetical protein